MVAGGKRDRAGRKPSAPTKQVRIPVSGADAARALVEAALTVSRRVMAERHPGITLSVRLIGVEIRRMERMSGAHTIAWYEGPAIVAEATDGEITERFFVSMCGLFYSAI